MWLVPYLFQDVPEEIEEEDSVGNVEGGIDEVVTRCPAAPEVPLDREDHHQDRPPVIACQASASDDIFGEKFREIPPVLNEAVVEDVVEIIPKHFVGESVGVEDNSNGNKQQKEPTVVEVLTQRLKQAHLMSERCS